MQWVSLLHGGLCIQKYLPTTLQKFAIFNQHDLPTSKKIANKKECIFKSLLFLTWQTILFSYAFASETLIYSSLFFHPPTRLHPREKHRCQIEYARVSLRVRGGFSQVAKHCQVICQTVGCGVFNVFNKKSRMLTRFGEILESFLGCRGRGW